MEHKITSQYEALALKYQQELDKKRFQVRFISWLRLVFFLAVIPVFIYLMPVSYLVGWIAVFVCLTAFLFLVKRSVSAEKQLKYLQNLVEINTNEIRGINRDFSPFDPGIDFIHPDHDY
ncbi:MAG: hypothetical protein Q7W54_06835, partial [Bacteroidota bacterium]|nr:hypothetical protein [Bacteroidota bacterium]